MEFPEFRGTYLGVPIRIVVFWGLYWGPPILGSYHVGLFHFLQSERPPNTSRLC